MNKLLACTTTTLHVTHDALLPDESTGKCHRRWCRRVWDRCDGRRKCESRKPTTTARHGSTTHARGPASRVHGSTLGLLNAREHTADQLFLYLRTCSRVVVGRLPTAAHSRACSRRTSSEMRSSALASVAASTTLGATPASYASFHLHARPGQSALQPRERIRTSWRDWGAPGGRHFSPSRKPASPEEQAASFQGCLQGPERAHRSA